MIGQTGTQKAASSVKTGNKLRIYLGASLIFVQVVMIVVYLLGIFDGDRWKELGLWVWSPGLGGVAFFYPEAFGFISGFISDILGAFAKRKGDS